MTGIQPPYKPASSTFDSLPPKSSSNSARSMPCMSHSPPATPPSAVTSPSHTKLDLAKRWNMKAQFALTRRFTVVRRLPIVVVVRPNTVPHPARRPAFYPQELRKHKHYLPSNAIILALRRASNDFKRSLQKPPVARP
ncbi:hypothetical protein KCU98_g4032, partial [Aureobasidium melanogenum]